MIDEKAFADAWALLEERFGRDYSEPMRDMYYRILSEKMDTEAFQYAAKRVFTENEFFPKPVDFIGPAIEFSEARRWHRIREEVEARYQEEVARLTSEARAQLPPGADPSEAYEEIRRLEIVPSIEEET